MSKAKPANKTESGQYNQLLTTISHTFTQGQTKTLAAINTGLVMTYWQIGQHIVEFEQQGQANAEYGQRLLANLSHDLKLKHGKGFSLSNLKRFRQFYLADRNGATLSHHLSWSHHVELLKVSNETERLFYIQQTLAANWSVRELKRQLADDALKQDAVIKDYLITAADGTTFNTKHYSLQAKALELNNGQRTEHNYSTVLRIDSVKRSFEPYWWALGMEAEMEKYLEEMGYDA